MPSAWLGMHEHAQGKQVAKWRATSSMMQGTCRLHPRQAGAASSPAWQRTTESARGSAG